MQPRIHLILFLTGALCVTLSLPALAEDAKSSDAVTPSPSACAVACANKLGVKACVTLDDMKACLQNDSVPECKGLNMSADDAAITANVCGACANLSVCVNAPAGTKATVAPKKRPTEKQLCKWQGGAFVQEPELDASGQPTGKILNHCFTQNEAYKRIVALEKKVSELSNGGGLSPADRAALDQLKELVKGQPLPPDFEDKLSALERLCPVAQDDPKATLSARCEHTMQRLDLTEHTAHEAWQKADNAQAEAMRAHERINDIHDQREAPEGKRPILLFGIVGTLHATESPIHKLPRLAGIEATWMPHLIPNLSLTFRGGIGTGAGVSKNGGAPLISLLGVGMCGPIPWTDDVVIGGIVSMEHWFRGDETSTFNFYGVGPEIFWFPGASKRTGRKIRHQEDLKVYGPEVESVGWRTMGGAIGARAVFGGSFAGRPGTKVASYWDQAFSLTATIGF